MGKIEIDHTGSGGGITLSSDGTDLLLNGTALSALELYDENAVLTSLTTTASGPVAVAIGYGATSSGNSSLAVGRTATASSTFSTAVGTSAVAASGNFATALTNSYASGTDSFAAAIANNTSSYGATGSESIAIGSRSKASSSNAVSIGGSSSAPSLASNSFSTAIGWATASGSGAFAVGNNTQATATQLNSVAISGNATATYSTAIGKSSDNQNASASGSGGIGLSGALAQGQDSLAVLLDARSVGANSVAIGSRARANEIGKFAFANGRFGVSGDAQGGMFILRADTTDATATVLTTNNSTAGSTNQIVAASDTCIMFSGTIVAMQNGAQDQGGWEIKGLLKNDGGTTTLVSSNIQTFADGNGWTVALSADNTNNALAITCTGEAAHNIRWVANISTSEVTYA